MEIQMPMNEEQMNEYYTKLLSQTSLEEKRAICLILQELTKAQSKHPDPWAINTKSKLYDHNYAASIVIEEAGELLEGVGLEVYDSVTSIKEAARNSLAKSDKRSNVV